ncbi:putative minus-end-directed kinesin ATPase [Medicago truncatula]|uniref:Kinesin-like protein n=1 Tax=Medicago truncatula TaxID=3880 RepID=A0A396HDC6_MEDTR|nr:kinesin-like protein KIN-14S [Medicago truncatula]RHN49285.1 putative minus-end-directed kinesin ATPase [Medicago truncatula]
MEEDRVIDMLTEKFNRFVIHCNFNSAPEQLNETSDSMDENTMSTQDGHTLPVLKKILDLSSKAQNLKKQHVALSEQVKLAFESFPGLDFLKSVQLIGDEYEILKRKYLEVSLERRRLNNEVIELKGNIRVFCRCRPLNENEIANGSAVSVVNFESNSEELQVVCSDSSKKQFKFDHVFKPEDNQEAVFAQTKPIVASVLDGHNVCIFAYGQTGTGKTFTMEGTPEHRGVNYRTLEELFRVSEERQGTIKYELLVSMLEVYNEKIKDLLAGNSSEATKKLEVKQAADGTQEVPGLVETHVYGADGVWEILKSGNRVRSVGSTSANELSSRSHCLVRVTVMGENLINGQRTKSHLWLVDLAGSERVGKTEAEGERLKESQFINKSLSSLGDVIAALASKSAHIPYRNSKLTHILQSSLGGDCKTLMFVQISPSSVDLTETLCSLNFATRVRGIESGPARKQVDLTELLKYKQMAEKSKHDEKEARKLQDNLQSVQMRLATREFMCRNLQDKVRDLENQIVEERKTRLKQESRSLVAEKTIKRTLLIPLERPPLRRINDSLPPPPERRPSSCSSSLQGKENNVRTNLMTTRRRVSIAARPPAAPSQAQPLQPRRRVSLATLKPETTSSQLTNGSNDHQPMVRNQRKARYSRLFAPLTTSAIETTPTLDKSSSSRFDGSPTQAADSRMMARHPHPAVIALQRKSLVWSPLKRRGIESSRKASFLPSRPSTQMR